MSYILYLLVLFILTFVIYVGFKAVKSNIELKKDHDSDILIQNLDDSKNDIINKLEKANEMKKKGIITEKEFINIKKKILND